DSDVEQYRDRVAYSRNMFKKGYQTRSQLDADISRLESAEFTLRKTKMERQILEKETKVRTVTDLQSKVKEAERNQERVKKQTETNEATARKEVENKKSVYLQELARAKEIEAEIAKCKVYCPQNGIVVYVVPEQARFGGGAQQSIVAQGEPVREG